MPVSYTLLKSIHVGCVALTIVLFAVRLGLAATGRDYRQYGPLRWIPHAVDTLLLGSAVLLAWTTAQYPFEMPWLTAKVLALPLYIIAGIVALDTRRPRFQRITGACVGVTLIAYIVTVALTRQPWPF